MSTEIVKICSKHGQLKAIELNTERKCIYCKREKDARWREANREKHRASANSSRNKNPEQRNEKERQNRLENLELYREKERIRRAKQGQRRNTLEVCRRRGITEHQFNLMMEKQNGLCAICGRQEWRKSRTDGKVTALCIDHCHSTNKVRQLLCHACNTAIGKFEDSVEIMEKAIAYINYHKRSG